MIEKYGEIPPEEMYEIFNMGLGMILAVSPEHVEKVQELLPEAFEIGRLVPRKTKAVIFKEAFMKIAVFASGNGSNFEAIC